MDPRILKALKDELKHTRDPRAIEELIDDIADLPLDAQVGGEFDPLQTPEGHGD